MLERHILSRRSFLQVGAVGLSGLTLPQVLAAEAAKDQPRAKACILIYLDGGPSHIDLFDMRPSPTREIRGPFQPIATSVPGTNICEHLPQIAQQMHRILQVQSMRHTETVHDPAVYQMLTGYKHLSSAGGLKVEPTDLPHLAAAFSQADITPAVMPKAICTPDLMRMDSSVLPGQGAGILSPAFEPWLVPVTRDGHVQQPDFRGRDDLPRPRLLSRGSLVDQFNAELSQLRSLAAADRLDRFRQQ